MSVSESIFGKIFDASIVEQSVIWTLRAWMPVYLKEIARQRSLEKIPPSPRTYTTRNNFNTFPDETMPMVVVISPGIAEPGVIREGDGTISAWYGIGVAVLARADTEEHTNQLAKIYAAAVRAIMEQQPGLNDDWEYGGTNFIDEDFTLDIPDEQERTIVAAQIVLRVLVMNITNWSAGPSYPVEPDPDTQPGSVWPTVQEADVVVRRMEEIA